MSHLNSRDVNAVLTVNRMLLRMHGEKHFQNGKRFLQEAHARMKLHSQNLRQKLTEAVKGEKSREEVAHMFHISVSAVKWYLRQCREQGHRLLNMISEHSVKKAISFRTGLFSGPLLRVRMGGRTPVRIF